MLGTELCKWVYWGAEGSPQRKDCGGARGGKGCQDNAGDGGEGVVLERQL